MLVDHLLNIALFILAGVILGTIIVDSDVREYQITGVDWGYLFAVYALANIVRLLLHVTFSPIIRNIGLGSNTNEMLFAAFAGLRGAVGLAMAVSLDNEVIEETVSIDPRRVQTNQLFFIIGGISLLTLLINGTCSGYVLKKLGLNRSTNERNVVIGRYSAHMKDRLLDKLVTMLGWKHFQNCSMEAIQKHVHILDSISADELKFATRRIKELTPLHLYKEPDLSMFESIINIEELEKIRRLSKIKLHDRFRETARKAAITRQFSNFKGDIESSARWLKELRYIFVEILEHVYEEAMESGQINVYNFGLVQKIENSLKLSEDQIAKDMPLDDWKQCQDWLRCLTKGKNTMIKLAAAFIQCHQDAEEIFRYDFCHNQMLTDEERTVVEESYKQVALANEYLDSVNPDVVKEVMTILLVHILLSTSAAMIGQYVEQGLLTETEGEHYREEIQHQLLHLKKSEKTILSDCK